MSDNDIVIHVVDKMYESDWSLEETITKKGKDNNDKTWLMCQKSLKMHVYPEKI